MPAPLVAAVALSMAGATAEVSPNRPEPREFWAEVPAAIGSPDEPLAVFEALVGDRVVPLADLGPAGQEWRLVLWFDQLLQSGVSFRNGALQLADRARRLTELGEVEIILAGDEITTALPATRDPDAVEQALLSLRLRETAEDAQVELRRRAVDGGDAAAAIEREAALLAGQRRRLVSWISERSTPGAKALLLVGAGFDAEPVRFYDRLPAAEPSDLETKTAPAPVFPTVAEVGAVLAAYGWVTFPYVPPQTSDTLVAATEAEAEVFSRTEEVEASGEQGKVVRPSDAVGIDPRKLFGRKRIEDAAGLELVLEPLAPLRELARATGGDTVRDALQLTELLVRLPARRRLKAATPLAAGEPEPVTVRVASGQAAGGEVLARRWVAGRVPQTVASVRVLELLLEDSEGGELSIAAAVRPEAEGARLAIQLEPVPASDAGAGSPLRVSLSSLPADGPPEVVHRVVPPPTRGPDEFPLIELKLPAGAFAESPLAVVVEDLVTGRWGSTYASAMGADTGEALAAADAPLLPAPKAVHLVAPRKPLVMGQTRFETVVSQERVARVDFYLDGQREAVLRSAPFAATLDLGPLPQTRRVEAVAYDGAGGELDRDLLVVNGGAAVFRVRIVEPDPKRLAARSAPVVGPLDVEAEIRSRPGTPIDRVEFYWRDSLVATRYAPPYRQRVVVPDDSPKGFVRVVALLEDGTSSEDVVFVNSPGESERLQVNLMELYVVVTDRRGRPVQGLGRDRFRVLEEGMAQEIATFSEAGELPLTVGLAIDSSASMFVKLPRVRRAAAGFVDRLVDRRDRAFVVGFGSQPALQHDTSADLGRVVRALDDLSPDGRTAIWQAVVYSLVQLQGVPGKKALIVYTDGADEDPDFSYRTALQFARKVGVPVYFILSNNEIVRTGGRGLSVRGFLNRLETLADSVGGRVFMARVGEDLDEVYREIEEELRSQYLVGYYAREGAAGEWREVEVDVSGAGLTARTIAGYFR